MRRPITQVAWIAILLVQPGVALASYVGTSPLLPPLDGAYLSPAQVHAEYKGPALDIVLSNIKHSGFSNIISNNIAPNVFETFDSTVSGNVSVNGGQSLPVTLTGLVNVTLFNYAPGELGTFITEMTALNLAGPTPFGPIEIRVDPVTPSTGQTTIQNIGGGQFRIDSFFDVFTDLSLDGGQTWIPSTGSTHVDLTNAVPEPSTWAMLLLGFAGLGFMTYWRKSNRTLMAA